MATASRNFDLQTALGHLPDQPGVYRMYSRSDELLYVGKAKNLKNRVRTYFQSPRLQAPKVQALMQNVARFDYIVTDSEVEALILEYNLIKEFRPRYNILLRDDKKFPWLALSSEPYPRIFMTRDPMHLGAKAKFFGPYASAGNMWRTLNVIRKHFPLRQRRKPLFKNRPCMNYYIGTCPGPCQNLINEEDYKSTVRQVELLLKGKADDLLEVLQKEMEQASEALNFELAAKLRDRYLAVQDVVAQQKMFYADNKVNQDIVATVSDERRCAVTVLSIRRGKLIGSHAHDIPLTLQTTPEEAYSTFVFQYYLELDPEDVPEEIILQHPIEDEALVQSWLSKKKGQKVTLTLPQKGIKKDLLTLGIKNAQETMEHSQLYESKQHRNDPARALMELQEALGLPEFPARMECYDISHIQGSNTVASMVVFINGVPDKKEYRRFKINTAEGMPDDFKSMAEVIRRRFSQAHRGQDDEQSEVSIEAQVQEVIVDEGAEASAENVSEPESELEFTNVLENSAHVFGNPDDYPAAALSEGKMDAAAAPLKASANKKVWDDPDLVIIDGGKGQLSAAVAVLEELGIEGQNIISLAKKFEEVYVPNQSRPVLLPRDSTALFLLQQIRDEAHRFAITYHRTLRAKSAKVSMLDNVIGIGQKRKEQLLKHFGSVTRLKKATFEEIRQSPGMTTPTANAVYQALHGVSHAIGDESV